VRRATRLSLERLAPYLLDIKPHFDAVSGHITPAPPLDWRAVFGNDRPVEVEVGSGKGLFLITAGAAHPETNFLGIEVVRGLQLYIATRIAKRSLTNVRVTASDAVWLLHALIPPASLSAVHVYFPDPWWKMRHKKRRVFTAEFTADCERALAIGGRLFIATDVEEYFQVMSGLVVERPGFHCISQAAESGEPRPEEVITNFERKARQRGETIWRAVFERRDR